MFAVMCCQHQVLKLMKLWGKLFCKTFACRNGGEKERKQGKDYNIKEVYNVTQEKYPFVYS